MRICWDGLLTAGWPSTAAKLESAAIERRAAMRRDRHKRYMEALRTVTFWMPCPLCGEHFSGAEWVNRISVPSGEHTTSGVCPACELELGAQAAEMCDLHGHEWVGRSRQVPVEVGPGSARDVQHRLHDPT